MIKLETDFTIPTGNEQEINAHRSDSPITLDTELPLIPLKDGKWQCLTFESSAEMLSIIDPVLREGALDDEGNPVALHKWQIEEHEKLCLANPKPTRKRPFKYALCAANGSGKDAYIVTPFVVWFITCKIRSLVVLTSSSGVQLSNQTENLIRNYCKKVNDFFEETYGAPILHIKQRHIECTLSGSIMYFFATDEEGKAEGYHPVEPHTEMAIVVNEAKSVDPKIFRALTRCTGFNYWINVSTPGEPVGDFYWAFENWEHTRRITYYDCPHMSPKDFEEDKIKYGEDSHLFRSKWLALFTFIGGKYVVNSGCLERLRNKVREKEIALLKQEMEKRVGIDMALSLTGGETSISAMKGNQHTHMITFRADNAEKVADKIESALLFEIKVPKTHPYIFADEGGVGRAIIDILKRRGWNIKRIQNQSVAHNKKQFGNRGAELWNKAARFFEESLIIPIDDDKLYKQLAARKYKENDTASIDKLVLQNKKEMVASGSPSPDRADSLVLALTDYNVKDFLAANQTATEQTVKLTIDKDEQIRKLEDRIWTNEKKRKVSEGKHSHFSLGAVLGKKNDREVTFTA